MNFVHTLGKIYIEKKHHLLCKHGSIIRRGKNKEAGNSRNHLSLLSVAEGNVGINSTENYSS